MLLGKKLTLGLDYIVYDITSEIVVITCKERMKKVYLERLGKTRERRKRRRKEDLRMYGSTK